MYRGFLEWAKYNVKGEDLSKDKETRVTTHNALVEQKNNYFLLWKKLIKTKQLFLK